MHINFVFIGENLAPQLKTGFEKHATEAYDIEDIKKTGTASVEINPVHLVAGESTIAFTGIASKETVPKLLGLKKEQYLSVLMTARYNLNTVYVQIFLVMSSSTPESYLS